MSIVELPPGTAIPDGAEDEASEVSISEPPDDKSPSVHKRKTKEQKAKRKMTETPTLLDPDLSHKKRSDQVVSTPPETRSEHSKNRSSKGRSSPRTPSRNSPLQTERSTPTSGIDSASSKLDTESSSHRRKVRASDGMTDKKTKSPTPTRANKEGRKTPVKRKKEVLDIESADKQLHPPADQYPQISPDLQRKPPPKPKAKKSEDVGDEAEVNLRPGSSANKRRPTKKEREIRERNVRTPDPEREPRERNVVTPDPVSRVDSGFEDNDSNATFERPCPVLERPPTPRQPRAPSPEERPLVVPLPPPRIPNASNISTQQFNPSVPENTTGHQIFCSEPPPIPERPVSMQIDPLQIPNELADLSSGNHSRNVDPPPIPERPHLGSIHGNTVEENNQKLRTADAMRNETEEKHELYRNGENSVPIQSNIKYPSEEIEFHAPITTDSYVNGNTKCSTDAEATSKASNHQEIETNELFENNNEIQFTNSSSGLQPRKGVTAEKSDKSKYAPVPAVSVVAQGLKEDGGSSSPKMKLKPESNSKSVIIPPTIQPKQQLNNSNISSDTIVNDFNQSHENNFVSSMTRPSDTNTQTSSAAFVDVSPAIPIKSGDTSIEQNTNVKTLEENQSNLKNINKAKDENVVQVEPMSTGKTHTITLEMPKIEPKVHHESISNTPTKTTEKHSPSPSSLTLKSNESGLNILSEKTSNNECNEIIVPSENKVSREPNQDNRSLTANSAMSSTRPEEKIEKAPVINNVDTIINPAPKSPPKKQPEKKVSIKQQLQQAALQKLQQQQARHAARQANVEKVSTTARPKTPQTFGNTPVKDLQKKDSLTSKQNEETNDIAPQVSIKATNIVTNEHDSSESRGSSAGKQDDGKSLINSVPKPFKPDGNWTEKSEPSPPPQQQSSKIQTSGKNELRKDNTSDSVASAISLSSSGSEHSLPRQTTLPNKIIHPDENIKRPFDNLLTSSPGGSSSSIQKSGQRDSKVIKAAQYWNNFIGDKSKPVVETAKPVETGDCID